MPIYDELAYATREYHKLDQACQAMAEQRDACGRTDVALEDPDHLDSQSPERQAEWHRLNQHVVELQRDRDAAGERVDELRRQDG